MIDEKANKPEKHGCGPIFHTREECEAPSELAPARGCLASIPHKCPKCDGQGIVSKPPWVAGDVHQWSSDQAVYTCDVCHGAKIIWSKPDNEKGQR